MTPATVSRGHPPIAAHVAMGLVTAGLAFASGAIASARPALALAATGAAVFFLVGLVNLPWGIALWTPAFFVPFLAVGNIWMKAGFVVVAIAAVGSLRQRWRLVDEVVRANARLLLLVVAFCGWLALSLLWSQRPSLGGTGLLAALLSAFVFIVVMTSASSTATIRLLVAAWIVGATATSLLGLLGTSPEALGGTVGYGAAPAGGLEFEGRLRGAIGDPNVLAGAAVAALALAAGLGAGVRRTAARVTLAAAGLVLVAALAASASRGAIVAAVVALVTALVVFKGGRGKVLVAGLVLVATCAVYIVAASPAEWSRLTNFDDQGSGRVDLWRVGRDVASDHPIAGVGLDNFRQRSAEYALDPGALTRVEYISETPSAVHNTYLEIWAEAGVVGFALYLALVLGAVLGCWRAATAFETLGLRHAAVLCRAMLVAIAALLATGFFISIGDDYRVWMLFALGPAAASVAARAGHAQP